MKELNKIGVQVRVINEERPIGCYGYSNDGFNDNVDGIHISWIYALLTDTEKFNLNRILHVVDTTTPEDIDYKEGWELVSDIYSYFLRALGYKDGHWKEREFKSTEIREVVKEYSVPGGRVEIVEIRNNDF